MIATVSPTMSTCEHSLNTLRYAYRVKEIPRGDDKSYPAVPGSLSDPDASVLGPSPPIDESEVVKALPIAVSTIPDTRLKSDRKIVNIVNMGGLSASPVNTPDPMLQPLNQVDSRPSTGSIASDTRATTVHQSAPETHYSPKKVTKQSQKTVGQAVGPQPVVPQPPKTSKQSSKKQADTTQTPPVGVVRAISSSED